MSKGRYSVITNWRRTFGSKASIPERKAICAEAKATTRLRRICTCSCLKSLDMDAKRKINVRSITILQNGRSPITFVFIFLGFKQFYHVHILPVFFYVQNWEKKGCFWCRVIKRLRLVRILVKKNARNRQLEARNSISCPFILPLSCLSTQFETQSDLCCYTYVNVEYAMIVSASAVNDSAQPT